MSARHRYWLKQERGIGDEAIRAGGLYSDGDVLVFPYVFGGKVVNRKHRGPGKKFWQDTDPFKTLWRIDDIGDAPDIWFVEGEMDALALMEAGIRNVVSVPDGAPQRVADEMPEPENDGKFAYLLNCADRLKGKRFVIATDNDGPGTALREELVRRLQRGRCDVLLWPDGVKDANALLLRDGPDELANYCRGNRRPYPIRGLASWGEILPTPPEQTFAVGVAGLGDYVRLARGVLMLITGIPGMGKTTLAKEIAVRMVQRYGWRIAIASFEDQVHGHLKPELMTTFMGGNPDLFSQGDQSQATLTLDRHVSFIFDEGEDLLDLDWLVDMARDAKLRFGIDMLVVDPWNELDHEWRRDLTEHQYIGRALKRLRRLAVELGIVVIIVAHPNKLAGDTVPGLYDVSGSSHWANKIDIGLVVHQPEHQMANGDGRTEVHVRKIKRLAYGKRGVVEVGFDERTRSYWPWNQQAAAE